MEHQALLQPSEMKNIQSSLQNVHNSANSVSNARGYRPMQTDAPWFKLKTPTMQIRMQIRKHHHSSVCGAFPNHVCQKS